MSYDHDKTDGSDAYVECARLELDYDGAPVVLQSMVRPGEFRVRGAAQPGASWPTTAEGFEAAREEQRAYDTQLRWQRSRKLALEALRVAEHGASMPWPRIEHLLSELVCELGCACCGKPFERAEVFTVEYVRARGVHAKNCEAP
jgi:hypothetical protein